MQSPPRSWCREKPRCKKCNQRMPFSAPLPKFSSQA
nr:MAG TPA: Bacterial peptidase [Caudoviricetes sp.]